MAYGARTPNSVEVLAAKDSITGHSTYVTSTNARLDVNASVVLSGTPIPIVGATTAVGVAIVDGSGNQITSFGGGTQYANGTAQATPTGTVALGYDGANVRALLTDATGKLSLGTVTISGSVTANAGTNLNTSLLALESGGNLATLAGTVTAAKVGVTVSNATLAVTQSGSWTVGTTPAVVNVGQQTVNTTAVQLSAGSNIPTNGILIGALSTNGASIFVGGSGVTTSTGAELQPGNSLPFTCNLNTLYIISVASTTDKIWYSVT